MGWFSSSSSSKKTITIPINYDQGYFYGQVVGDYGAFNVQVILKDNSDREDLILVSYNTNTILEINKGSCFTNAHESFVKNNINTETNVVSIEIIYSMDDNNNLTSVDYNIPWKYICGPINGYAKGALGFGGSKKASTCIKRTKEKITIGKREHSVYVGPRGGRYIKKAGEFVSLKKLGQKN